MRSKWKDIKNQVLGKKYDLSVVFVGDEIMKNLNKIYRKKDKIANVLSFPLSKENGEILINDKFKKEKEYSDYLFMHSLLHLKGLRHGKKMEKEEKELIKKFNICHET